MLISQLFVYKKAAPGKILKKYSKREMELWLIEIELELMDVSKGLGTTFPSYSYGF